MIWPIKITGYTHTMSGKKRTVNATVEGAGNAKQAVLDYMLSKKTASDWYGVEVRGITPLGQTVLVIVEPYQRQVASQIHTTVKDMITEF